MVIKNLLILGAGDPGALENFFRAGLEKCGVKVETYIIADQYYAALKKSIFNKVLNKLSPDFFYRDINDKLIFFLAKKKFDVILVFKGMELFPATVEKLKDHAILLANYNADHPFVFYKPGSGNNHVLNSIAYYDVYFSYTKSIVSQLKNNFNKQSYCVPFGYNNNLAVTAPAGISLGVEYVNRFLFVGAFDSERQRYLDELHSSMLDIYGDSKWKSRNLLHQYLQKAYRNKLLYGLDYINAVKSSLGMINLLRKQNLEEDSHNMRTFEVPGYGGLLLSQRTSEQMEFFEEDKEAVFFNTIDELRDKMRYLSRNHSVVSSIKQAAEKKSILAKYNYDERSKLLLNFLQTNF